MDTSAASKAALEREIAMLSGAIDRFKNNGSTSTSNYPQASSSHSAPTGRPRNSAYLNSSFKPANKYVRPGVNIPSTSTAPIKPPQSQAEHGFQKTASTVTLPAQNHAHDVVLGGVAFESSGRSLVRKDLPKPAPTSRKAPVPSTRGGHLIPGGRAYKAKTSSRGRGRGRGRPGNMTLANSRRPYQSRRTTKRKQINKPCARFTSTGSCNRGLTCMYQHDPAKVAICWKFLSGNCPESAETCALSHDPTPERTPLCVHFANQGRCTRAGCPFPHVRVGPREGVCRDFAVMGYCERGLECTHQHVRECPDFAETGACKTKGCKLPHVIRANRNRKTVPAQAIVAAAESSSGAAPDGAATDAPSLPQVSAEDAQLGDEYISLIFHESEEDDEEDSDDEEDEDEEDEGEGEDHVDKEGSSDESPMHDLEE